MALAPGPRRPAGPLCVTLCGDVFRQDGSKYPRANCENSKAKEKKGASDDLESVLLYFPVLISCSVLPLGALQKLTMAGVQCSAGPLLLSFFLMNAR